MLCDAGQQSKAKNSSNDALKGTRDTCHGAKRSWRSPRGWDCPGTAPRKELPAPCQLLTGGMGQKGPKSHLSRRVALSQQGGPVPAAWPCASSRVPAGKGIPGGEGVAFPGEAAISRHLRHRGVAQLRLRRVKRGPGANPDAAQPVPGHPSDDSDIQAMRATSNSPAPPPSLSTRVVRSLRHFTPIICAR